MEASMGSLPSYLKGFVPWSVREDDWCRRREAHASNLGSDRGNAFRTRGAASLRDDYIPRFPRESRSAPLPCGDGHSGGWQGSCNGAACVECAVSGAGFFLSCEG